MIEGEISDSALVDLVEFIRSSPSGVTIVENAHGSATMKRALDGHNAITSISARGDNEFSVLLESRPGAGQDATILRSKDGWKIANVSNWVE